MVFCDCLRSLLEYTNNNEIPVNNPLCRSCVPVRIYEKKGKYHSINAQRITNWFGGCRNVRRTHSTPQVARIIAAIFFARIQFTVHRPAQPSPSRFYTFKTKPNTTCHTTQKFSVLQLIPNTNAVDVISCLPFEFRCVCTGVCSVSDAFNVASTCNRFNR